MSHRKRSLVALIIRTVLVLPAVLIPIAAQPAQGQEEVLPERSVFRVSAFPYLGAVWTERETRLPFATSAGFRVTFEIWNQVTSNLKVGTFLGAAGTALAVNHARVCTPACPGQNELRLDYLVTLEAGFVTDLPNEPYLLAFVGQAYPAAASNFDPVTQTYRNSQSMTWGVGVGFSPSVGRLNLRTEVRHRNDQRAEVGMRNSWEVLLGVPFGSG